MMIKNSLLLGFFLFGLLIGLILIAPGKGIAQEAWSIKSFDWKPDGTQVAVGYDNGITKIWDVSAGLTEVASFLVASESTWPDDNPFFVEAVAWSPDGTKFAIGASAQYNAGFVRIFDATTGVLLNSFSDVNRSTAVAWSPDGTLLAGVVMSLPGPGVKSKVNIWDVSTFQVIASLDHNGYSNYLLDINWSPDGSRLVTANSDGRAIVWDTTTWELLFTLNHPDSLFSVEWNPNGMTIATGSDDGSVRIWDAGTGQLLKTLPNGYEGVYVTDLSWNPDGTLLATAVSRSIQIWDVNLGEIVEVIEAPPRHWFSLVTWSPIRDTLLIRSQATGELLIKEYPLSE